MGMTSIRALAGATAWVSAFWMATSPLSAASAQPAPAAQPGQPQTLDDFLADGVGPAPAPAAPLADAPAVPSDDALPPPDLVGPLDGALPWPPLVTPNDAAQPASALEAADDDAAAAAAATGPAAQPAISSTIVTEVADWIAATHDNRGLPYVIIDKVGAKVFVFNRRGVLRGSAPVLVGAALGDDSTPGIGDREMSNIKPSERTTPAGRFLAGFGPGWGGKKVIWVDYKAAIALHPVVTAHPKERRPQRLASPTPDDNRISYGCLNVTAAFYRKVVQPTFARSNAIVYILPDTKPLETVFPAMGLWMVARADQPPPDAATAQTAAAAPAAEQAAAAKPAHLAHKRRSPVEQTASR